MDTNNKPTKIDLPKNSLKDLGIGALVPKPALDLDKLRGPRLSELYGPNKAITEYFEKLSRSMEFVGETTRKLAEATMLPTMRLVEALRPVIAYQDAFAEQILSTQKALHALVLNNGLLEIANTFKGMQFDAFAGIVINSDVQETISSAKNGVVEVTSIRNSTLMAGGEVKFGLEKSSSTSITAQVVYRKVERIDTNVQLLNENLASTQKELALMKNLLSSHGNLLKALEENPFPFFRIKRIQFISRSSTLLVNGVIPVQIKSKTLLDYICQVLFSGTKEITEQWDYEELLSHANGILGYGEAENITWKKLRDVIASINNKIATETTVKDVILIPRSEIIQLNPRYFITS